MGFKNVMSQVSSPGRNKQPTPTRLSFSSKSQSKRPPMEKRTSTSHQQQHQHNPHPHPKTIMAPQARSMVSDVTTALSPTPAPQMQQQYSQQPKKRVNVTVTILSIAGLCVKDKEAKKKTGITSISKKFSRNNSKTDDQQAEGGGDTSTLNTGDSETANATTSIVASFSRTVNAKLKSKGGNNNNNNNNNKVVARTVMTHVPSLPLPLIGAGSSNSKMLNAGCVVRWPEQPDDATANPTNNITGGRVLSSYQFQRTFQREVNTNTTSQLFSASASSSTSSSHERFVPQPLDIQIAISRSGRMFKLGTAHVLLSGEENGESSINVPIENCNHPDTPNKVVSGLQNKKVPMMKLKGDTLKCGLDPNATLRVLVHVSEPIIVGETLKLKMLKLESKKSNNIGIQQHTTTTPPGTTNLRVPMITTSNGTTKDAHLQNIYQASLKQKKQNSNHHKAASLPLIGIPSLGAPMTSLSLPLLNNNSNNVNVIPTTSPHTHNMNMNMNMNNMGSTVYGSLATTTATPTVAAPEYPSEIGWEYNPTRAAVIVQSPSFRNGNGVGIGNNNNNSNNNNGNEINYVNIDNDDESSEQDMVRVVTLVDDIDSRTDNHTHVTSYSYQEDNHNDDDNDDDDDDHSCTSSAYMSYDIMNYNHNHNNLRYPTKNKNMTRSYSTATTNTTRSSSLSSVMSDLTDQHSWLSQTGVEVIPFAPRNVNGGGGGAGAKLDVAQLPPNSRLRDLGIEEDDETTKADGILAANPGPTCGPSFITGEQQEASSSSSSETGTTTPTTKRVSFLLKVAATRKSWRERLACGIRMPACGPTHELDSLGGEIEDGVYHYEEEEEDGLLSIVNEDGDDDDDDDEEEEDEETEEDTHNVIASSGRKYGFVGRCEPMEIQRPYFTEGTSTFDCFDFDDDDDDDDDDSDESSDLM